MTPARVDSCADLSPCLSGGLCDMCFGTLGIVMARMAHLSPVPIPPRHRPACRSMSESYFALEPWDHRLPIRRFPRLLLQPLPARKWGLQSRASTGRGTCRARPRGCLLHSWGTGLATQCRLASPSTGRVCAAHTLGIPQPDVSIVRPATCGVVYRRAGASMRAHRRPPCPGL
jgi:hypothetical protein